MIASAFGVLFDGFAYGMLLFLLSVGLSVTLGMMNFVNLAHCSFGMLGGYVTVTLMDRLGWPFFATLPAAFFAAALFAVLGPTLHLGAFATYDAMALFLLALFASPLVRMIGGGYPIGNNVVLYPIVAPALVLVGVMMMESVRHIRWDDYTESIPAFLTLVTMPLAVSITDGIAFGFISTALLKVATGRARELSLLGYVFAALFVIRYMM